MVTITTWSIEAQRGTLCPQNPSGLIDYDLTLKMNGGDGDKEIPFPEEETITVS